MSWFQRAPEVADMEFIGETKEILRREFLYVQLAMRKRLVLASDVGRFHTHIGKVGTWLSGDVWVLSPPNARHPLFPQ